MATLVINGRDTEFGDRQLPGNLAQLLAHMEIDAATVVAEIDGKIVKRQDFAETCVSDGQKIELLRFVGGG